MPRRIKLIIAGLLVAVVVLVAAAVLLYVNIWSPPTKQDFEQAKSTVSQLDSQYKDLSTSLQLYSSSITAKQTDGSKQAKAGFTKAENAVAASFKKLDQSRVMRDKQVKAAYDTLVKKQGDIQSFADGFVLYQSLFVKCIDVFDVTHGSSDGAKIAAAHKKAAADCLPLLDEMSRSKTPYFANYAKHYASAIRKRQTVFDSYAAKKLSESEASAKITEIAHTDLKAVLGSDDGLIKARQNASAYEPLQQLKKVLDQKIKQS